MLALATIGQASQPPWQSPTFINYRAVTQLRLRHERAGSGEVGDIQSHGAGHAGLPGSEAGFSAAFHNSLPLPVSNSPCKVREGPQFFQWGDDKGVEL